MPYLLQLMSERGKTNFVVKRTTKATFAKGKQVMEILQQDGRYKSFLTDEPAKSPIPKTQKKTQKQTVFGELGFVMTSMTSTKTTPR